MVKVLGDRVLVKAKEAEKTSSGGIVLIESAAEKPAEGTIISIGGKVEEVKVGDEVIYGKYAGSELKNDGETYLTMRETDILAVIIP